MHAFLKKEERSQKNNLALYLKESGKEQQIKPQIIIIQEIIYIRVEISCIKKKKKEQINETRSWFFERINKIYKPLTSLIKKKRKGPK